MILFIPSIFRILARVTVKIGTDNRRNLIFVIGPVTLDLGGGLLARTTARKARSGIRHLTIDASAPAISAGPLALDANAGLGIGLA